MTSPKPIQYLILCHSIWQARTFAKAHQIKKWKYVTKPDDFHGLVNCRYIRLQGWEKFGKVSGLNNEFLFYGMDHGFVEVDEMGPFDNFEIPPPSGIEALVCDDIAKRQQLGLSKYGTTVADSPLPLRAWLVHAYQECLDQAVYLRRAIDKMDQDEEHENDLDTSGGIL